MLIIAIAVIVKCIHRRIKKNKSEDDSGDNTEYDNNYGYNDYNYYGEHAAGYNTNYGM